MVSIYSALCAFLPSLIYLIIKDKKVLLNMYIAFYYICLDGI